MLFTSSLLRANCTMLLCKNMYFEEFICILSLTLSLSLPWSRIQEVVLMWFIVPCYDPFSGGWARGVLPALSWLLHSSCARERGQNMYLNCGMDRRRKGSQVEGKN